MFIDSQLSPLVRGGGCCVYVTMLYICYEKAVPATATAGSFGINKFRLLRHLYLDSLGHFNCQ